MARRRKHEVDRAVVREQLADLVLVVFQQAWVLRRLHFGRATLNRDAVFPEPPEIVGRVVETGRDALRAKRGHDLAGDVALEGRVRDVEIRGLRRPQAKPRVVFRGEHDIAHAGEAGEGGPVFGVKLARVERARQLREVTRHVVVGRADE